MPETMGYTGQRWADLTTATISIIIPTRNAGPEFRETLAAIRGQTRTSELVVVDSGSTDGTPDLAREFQAVTISIPPESFNHGETRNFGIRHSQGGFCIMLVQDAIPVGDTWLEELVSPFSDPRVVGVTGAQVPRPDSDPVGRWQVEYRNRFLGEEMRVQELENWDQFRSLSFQDRLRLVSFDNVCSALRREFWERSPFEPLPFAEDLDWGVRAIAAGKRIVHHPATRVIHSHSRPGAYHMRRSYISGRIVPKLLHVEPADSGVRNDAEFLAVLGSLCGEVRTMLARDISDWRGFNKQCTVQPGLWKSFLYATGLQPPLPGYKLSPMRGDFYFVLEQLAELAGKPGWNSVMVQALGEVAGAFSASYYNWCEVHGTISPGMRDLDRILSKGV
ncbi:MAG: glycosyltransferase [Acidobacteriota bacterium]|nr:glycosyltransferase [Acidobacteriota bacterium]